MQWELIYVFLQIFAIFATNLLASPPTFAILGTLRTTIFLCFIERRIVLSSSPIFSIVRSDFTTSLPQPQPCQFYSYPTSLDYAEAVELLGAYNDKLRRENDKKYFDNLARSFRKSRETCQTQNEGHGSSVITYKPIWPKNPNKSQQTRKPAYIRTNYVPSLADKLQRLRLKKGP